MFVISFIYLFYNYRRFFFAFLGTFTNLMPRFFSRGGVGVSGELWRHLKCALPSSFFFYPPLLTSSALARAEAPPSLIVSATWSSMWWMADKRFNGASVAQVVVFLFPSKIDGCPFVSDGHHQAPPLASPFENPFRIIRHLLCHQLFCFLLLTKKLLWCNRQISLFFFSIFNLNCNFPWTRETIHERQSPYLVFRV